MIPWKLKLVSFVCIRGCVEMAGSREHFQSLDTSLPAHSELDTENEGLGKEYVSTLRRFSSREYVDMCEGGECLPFYATLWHQAGD